jgi:hypothetical protein
LPLSIRWTAAFSAITIDALSVQTFPCGRTVACNRTGAFASVAALALAAKAGPRDRALPLSIRWTAATPSITILAFAVQTFECGWTIF